MLKAADRRFSLGLDFEQEEIGFTAYDACGTTLPDHVLDKAKRSEGIILGPISHLDYPPRDKGGVNISAAMRVKLDLYANVRPARTREGVPSPIGPFDLVIMRECTEGFYPDRNMYAGGGEFMPDENMALSVRKITATASNRIARRSFELAMTRRKKVTAVHKANNFILSDGLFLREVRKVAAEFPEVTYDEKIVDAMAALLVRDPQQFDVICATNFHADILSDLASELSGRLGLAGSVNMNEEMCCAQAQHGSAPDIAGQDRANPTPLILSAAMLLDWMGKRRRDMQYRDAARAIEEAIDTALANLRKRTRDLGGPLGMADFAGHLESLVIESTAS